MTLRASGGAKNVKDWMKVTFQGCGNGDCHGWRHLSWSPDCKLEVLQIFVPWYIASQPPVTKLEKLQHELSAIVQDGLRNKDRQTLHKLLGDTITNQARKKAGKTLGQKKWSRKPLTVQSSPVHSIHREDSCEVQSSPARPLKWKAKGKADQEVIELTDDDKEEAPFFKSAQSSILSQLNSLSGMPVTGPIHPKPQPFPLATSIAGPSTMLDSSLVPRTFGRNDTLFEYVEGINVWLDQDKPLTPVELDILENLMKSLERKGVGLM
ncbi:hypothetical protein GYMLUDRAFT_244014 [Collybiopsis luxurians FD-317 M1]|uniref:Uncharacterized protein n=1 Tax=Collybiopsis luxurians FD-317 M1 TaxID=944289 RepID=A0A0D0BYH6_9AGAR|nr:hypothetical protein GYMLUDRAFT_244014 [Collybiopsis luxurians FD-317 M1]